jgi:hypothetical protein
VIQTYSADGVRQDRTGWRDQQISERHRQWGIDCPAVDLDLLMVEYNFGRPAGLVEYKHHLCDPARIELAHPTYRALCELANSAGIPFLVARYWPGIWAFEIMPVNPAAKAWFRENEQLTEEQFVERLYELRQQSLNDSLRDRLNLNTEMPPWNIDRHI